jgi:hypothetical protein
VFNQPDSLNPQADMTLTFTPITNVWLRLGRTWIDGTLSVDWVYFNRSKYERGTNNLYRVGVAREMNRLAVRALASRNSTRDRPNMEIDLRSQRFERIFMAEATYRLLSRTSFGGRFTNFQTTYDKDAFFLGASLPVELNRTTITNVALVKHTLTPLTTVQFEAGTEDEEFFQASRRIDGSRVVGTVTFDQSALLSGTASIGVKSLDPVNPALPNDRLTTANLNLTYRLLGSTQLMAQGTRDFMHSIDVLHPLQSQTAFMWTVQRQVRGPFDVLARYGHASIGLRDRIGGVVADEKRRESLRTFGGGLGYRLGFDKRVGFNLDSVKRSSSLDLRRFHALRYGVSITYER